jgi:DNA invertase Pin-like site-specific DNA recombinase
MTSPTGGLLANVTASVAEWERKTISTRTKGALAAKRAGGIQLGRLAYWTRPSLSGYPLSVPVGPRCRRSLTS